MCIYKYKRWFFKLQKHYMYAPHAHNKCDMLHQKVPQGYGKFSLRLIGPAMFDATFNLVGVP